MALINMAPETVEENIKRIDEFSEMKCHNNYPVGCMGELDYVRSTKEVPPRKNVKV
jgi:hypothetical protein